MNYGSITREQLIELIEAKDDEIERLNNVIRVKQKALEFFEDMYRAKNTTKETEQKGEYYEF